MNASHDLPRNTRLVVVAAEETLLGTGRDDERVQVLGHRGAPVDGIRENSAAAVTEALLRGADGVEIDVWLTSDGTLVCTHDLDSAPVETLSTLTEVLAAVQVSDGFRVVVEAKPVADADLALRTAQALADVLRVATGTADVTVSSFDRALLAAIRSTCADLPVRTALLGNRSDAVEKIVRRAAEDGHDEVHLSLTALRRSPATVETARELGLSVALWTVNHAEDLYWAAEIGVDAVITDEVLVAWSVLDRAADARSFAFAA